MGNASVTGADGGLTMAEVEQLEELYTPAVLREILIHYARARQDRLGGRLGLFVHLNGRGQPVEYESWTPRKVRRKTLDVA